ncbi:MAG: hypothetical protein NWT08_05875 [Akkermansiaceae bacterium]|jgi:YHS domain-containing protein|nr:hypothetical protein [Akkermansiaceae bacterium]MDP4645779.1 hypothetical protein [Akkermansiaceae bacterium]MDP4720082.1 hypothetical protein [Akkermansiaceae bacterium]MDP4781536.1 hypothetical protein [Akkermansiaceae bacterium]MDP4847948.1 hypothetical protein [Akkermansiaceae bacterium]
MKTKHTTIALLAAAALFSSCEKPSPESSAEVPGENLSPVASDDSYPLTTCPVSGEKLGEMGDPYVIEHEGTTVKLCCKSCIKDFNKDPDKYIGMIKTAEKQ